MSDEHDELRRILQEEFRHEQKSNKRLVLVLVALVAVAVIAGTLFVTNLLSGVSSANTNQDNAFVPDTSQATTQDTAQNTTEQISGGVPEGETASTPNESPQEEPPAETPPTENIVCDYSTNPPTCTSV